MSKIPHVIEASAVVPDYSGHEFSEEDIAEGAHRRFVGGVWDTHGKRQLDYMKTRGLEPQHTMIDVGCGCFRAGRLFVDYLEPGHYYGVDANPTLMQVGYDVELSDEQRERLPVENLRTNDRFNLDFGTTFDFAIAQSVFTHVSLNHIRLCLYRAATVVKPGGSFYATFFERARSTPLDHIISSHKVKPFYTEKNVYWYYREDLEWAAKDGPWKVEYIGDWGHPAGQKMMRYVRLTDAEVAQRRKSSAAQAPLKKPATPAKNIAAPAGKASGPTTVGQDLRSFSVRGLRWAARRLDRKGPGAKR